MNWNDLLPPVFRRRTRKAGKSLIDGEYISSSIERSPVPVILIMVLTWMVAAVLLTLSDSRQRDLTVWADSQKAPFSVWARCDFQYEDTPATEDARKRAEQQEPPVYRIDSERQKQVTRAVAGFLSALQLREQTEAEKRVFVSGDNPGSRIVAGLFEFKPILAALKQHGPELKDVLDPMVRHGVAGRTLKLPPMNAKLRIIAPDGRNYHRRPPRPAECAAAMADALQLTGNPRREFIGSIETLLEPGTVDFDPVATAAARKEAAAAVGPVIRHKLRGDLLVERNKLITRETVDMMAAEREALPDGFGVAVFYYRMGLCFLIMAAALFFLYRTYPKIFTSTRRIALGGAVIIISLLANYGALQLFFQFFRNGLVPEYELMLFMVPIPLGAALMSILLGNRTALFSGFMVAAVTALMVLPDRSFELALRWFAIAALTTLIIRDVRNYRSFFVRIFFGGALLLAVVNSDVLFSLSEVRLWKIAGIAIVANAFACAVADLLLVFVFELVFNTDTNMSLMVLCDYNHPLLEKLKREAPGTMFHAMTVATLAEDAARAIKANPLRAKAGALFHDIGKLAMPQYFVENNVDSPKDHLAMPPQRSCGIIRGHVKEGLALARSYRLCGFIREAIATHHGDDLISFFYRRALEQQAENPDANAAPVLESQFRYDGQPPTEKELTIIALADACEAASRSLNRPSPAKIESLVSDIFIGRLRGGQLRNSQLTLEELAIVRECFIADLISFNHGRIAYQQEKSDDPTALPVAEPPAPGPEKK